MGFLTWILAIVVIANSVYIYILTKRIKNITKYFLNKLSEVKVDSKLSLLLADTNSNHDDIHTLANNLFSQIKNIFGLRAKSYSEIAVEIRSLKDIDNELQQALVNFFEEMVALSYKNEDISPIRRDDIKAKLKMIFKKLPMQQ